MYFQIAKIYRQYNDIYIMRYIYVTATQECGDFNLVLLKVNAHSLVMNLNVSLHLLSGLWETRP